MASKSLRDILGYVSLTGLVNANVPDLPVPLPSAFRSNVKKVEGNTGRYTRLVNARTVARLNKYGAAALPVNMQPIGEFDVKCLSQFESITLDPWTLLALRNFTNYDLQDRAKDLVAFQAAEFRRRSDHLRNTVDMIALSRGKIWYDVDGNLLPSSSGAAVTADFQIPASQVGATIATLTGISGAWATASTNIPTQLVEMKRIAQRAHGYEPMIIMYGKNIPALISKNDYMQPYLARQETNFRPQWLKDGDIQPSYELLGYKWFPAYQSFWKDQNGATQEIVDDNAIIFLPAPSQTWWEHMEGQQLVPTNFNPVQTDLSGVNNDYKMVHGRGMYAVQGIQPNVSITMYGFDNFTPVIKVPEVVYSLTCA